MRPIFEARARDSLLEAVLAQAEQGKTVVPAIKFCQAPRDRLALNTFHSPNPCIEPRGGVQIIAPQTAAPLMQGARRRITSEPKGIRGSETGNDERLQARPREDQEPVT